MFVMSYLGAGFNMLERKIKDAFISFEEFPVQHFEGIQY